MKKVILIFLILMIAHAGRAAFKKYCQRVENLVQGLAAALRNSFNARCSDEVCQCAVKSYDSCVGTCERHCSKDFPRPESCESGGISISSRSGVRFPLSTDMNNLPATANMMVCATALIEEQFSALDKARDGKITYAYFGGLQGIFREYPPTGGGCEDYDPRLRPWYIAATNAPKNVIIMVDTSIASGTKLQILQQATGAVVRKISPLDHVAMIFFSDALNVVNGATSLQQFSPYLKISFQKAIASLSQGNSPNYQLAFQKAVQLFNSANMNSSDSEGTKCNPSENIILFLSDGKDSSFDAAALKSFITGQIVGGYKLRVFGLGIGAESEANFPRLSEFSCDFESSIAKMQSQQISELLTALAGYEKYSALSSHISHPVWNGPYADAFGNGQTLTVSLPVFYDEGFAGVVALDINYKQMLTDFSISSEDVRDVLEASVTCPAVLTACEWKQIRGLDEMCGVVTGCTPGQVCPHSQSQDAFATPQVSSNEICCEESLTYNLWWIWLIICLGVIMFVVLLYGLWRCRRSPAAISAPELPFDKQVSMNQLPAPSEEVLTDLPQQ